MNTFTPEQLAQINATVRTAVREELSDAGLRLDDANHQDEARRDFMFLRSMRRGVNGAAAKIGWLVILAIIGGVWTLIQLGLNAWRGA